MDSSKSKITENTDFMKRLMLSSREKSLLELTMKIENGIALQY
jgi:hypothetical protein